MGQVEKDKLLAAMKKREKALQERSDRDFSGGYDSGHIGRLKELSYWIGAIERNEFDIKIWD